jgi:ppGpp synthetase/RelA/SpoT-type nucleotidyltranferase
MALLNGMTKGKSHKEGGIPMKVRSTGQEIEMEGGELVTNKTNSADPTKFEFEGKQLTTCEITSILNSRNNNGVKIDCDSIVGKKYEYKGGGKIYDKANVMHPTNSKIKNKLKDDFNVTFKPKNIFYPKQSLGLKRNEMPQIRSKFLPILFNELDNDRIRYKDIRVDANTLKPSQNEINIDTASKFSKDAPYMKRALVSSDNYIIDGHHRWYFCLMNDLPIDITKIDLPIEEALNYIRQLDFIEIDQIAKGGKIIDSQKTLFDGGGNVQVSKYSKEIPLSIYKGVISDYDKDGIANADDLEPNKKSDIQLEEISLKDELTDIIKYRNLFVGVQEQVLKKIGEINTCGKIECNIKTRIKTPYSIINKLRRRSLTDVKTLDKLDKKAKDFLKNKTLKGIDLYKGLTDVLGFMVIVEDFDSLNKLKNEIEQGQLGEVLEFEDFYANDNNGYRAYHFLLSTELKGTFIPYELQIRTARVNKLSGITHTIYKQGKLNGVLNDKLAKQIELADKGNKVIARLVDAELEDKNLSNKLTIQKFALGDIVMGAWLSSYQYKVRNNANKRISYLTEFAENELKARKEINKKYKDFTILAISINDKDYVPIDEFVDKEIDRSQVDLFDTHQERFEYADELKKGGVIYQDLSLIEPKVLMDSSNTFSTEIDEVSIVKTGKTFVFHNRQIKSSQDSYDLLKDFWNLENIDVVEEMNVIYLDKQNKPISIYQHSKGGIDSTIADIEVVSAIAVKTLAKGVIMSHNHPSGNLNPSPADLEISKQLKNALKLFGITLLDSMIVNKDGYKSMADSGTFKRGGGIENKDKITHTIFRTKNKKEALNKLKELNESEDEKDMLFSYELIVVPRLNEIMGSYNEYRIVTNYKYVKGGGINPNCNCPKCVSYRNELVLDEADTKNGGKMFLVKLKKFFYVIYDDEIVSKSSNLKDAKKDFELGLYHDKILEKKKFVEGGAISESEYNSLEKIVPKNMLLSIKETKESWKRGDSDDIFEHYENLIEGYREIPTLYFQDEKGKNAIVYLHYFSGGSDWYITELDKENNEGFGYVILNGDTQNSEFGYINMNELANSNINIDLYWSFQTLNEIFEKKYPELVDGETEYFNKDATLTRLTDFEILIEKNAFKNQYEVNQLIELMIDEKGMDSNMYTTIEQSFLQRYSGMGGLQKFGAKGKGILWEYYTPKNVADIMWQLAYKYKSVSKFERVLENSVGVGTFVNSCPLQVGSMDCYDISKYAIAICEILYGKDERFTFLHRSFETKFFNGNTSVKGNVTPIYDLVIGNPPYSEYSGKYAGMGEKKYTKAENYIDYFIFRSLDLLKSGGLLVYILGSVKGVGQDNWLESKDNYTKTEIKKKADLVDALRLGSGVFEFTDVDSDIIVLRKK